MRELILEILERGPRNPSFMAGLVLTGLFVLVALVSLVWTPEPVDIAPIARRLKPPAWPWTTRHFLGTDQFGRDLVSMVMGGAFNSGLVAVVAVAIGLGAGVPLGALAAARGGLVDDVVMRLTDFAFAFPALLTAVMITALFGPGAVNSILAIGLFNVPVFARLTRGAALSVWQRPFVMAARAAGRGPLAITVDHILPNVASVLIVQGTIQFALAILAEAGLSFLGLGTQPPQPSWGRMLAEAQTRFLGSPHLALVPGLAIVVTVLGLNLLGDGLRDVLDPRLSRRQ